MVIDRHLDNMFLDFHNDSCGVAGNFESYEQIFKRRAWVKLSAQTLGKQRAFAV